MVIGQGINVIMKTQNDSIPIILCLVSIVAASFKGGGCLMPNSVTRSAHINQPGHFIPNIIISPTIIIPMTLCAFPKRL